ncbi:FAD-dependent oxidoreductase [Mesorhizobium sp. BAC0120]|uniref:NAD(P)/FAD-dependent oxidoreductase n=1 Tax=Mesorhizobium sp. BAC0120 TaxID=3090670 RepID=UPI00298CA7B8|nr:FAD-dependent oxidoreductase [Mesorhizobium sp. BAC0120]MDW6021139.1 FAD-dependent oxidoreductase [Mesorhizobium sp. BAC0120]
MARDVTLSDRPTVAPADPSWWFAEAIAAEKGAEPAAALNGTLAVDVAIVGGGYTGLWTALALKERRPSLSIALIEASLCGSGASGKNGGKVHGYWAGLAGMAKAIGDDAAVAVARAGTRAQDAIRAFATAPGRDVWWRDSGNLRISASPAQDPKVSLMVNEARRLDEPDSAQPLNPAEVAARCRSPVFRAGVFLPEGANLHPARMARALRRAAIDTGVQVFEHTPMVALDKGSPNRIRVPAGEVIAREVVLATNVDLAATPEVRPHVSVFSSYALMTEPAPEQVAAMSWTGDEGIADLRMFVHYFRKTPDGRVLMGSGSGPISYGGDTSSRRLREDLASAGRAERGLRRLLPGLASVKVAKSWGGAIDVSADRLPFFRTIPGTRIHFGCGYSGHGVNPTYMGGQCLASLVLGERDFWGTLPLCTRDVPTLPPEPFRFIGGSAIRRAIIACEEAEEREQSPSTIARVTASLPRVLGMRIGTR